ncbi:DEAD/DEAH box helicase [Arthrobacter sulfonylureivorans]|uniref:DEAD/DEAH box helicase n=1 Tax=Arthrobacter sulfonylureivorans TaxID=2486855 RepID=A0ABY3WDY7_9MICC|nr:DEAD/DEAH box helicase [Arthrobacter sulfonylureivorans]UNK46532.1 DEAD/DEAH box helicase [Arthrobacter sulfonylureivorans]
MTTFAALGVPKPLVSKLAADGIEAPFPIQTETLPDTLAGRDVLGRGRTGSGKTLAFALPMVARLAEREAAHFRKPGRPLGLVLAPTRELATQLNNTIEPLAVELGLNTTVIYGGVSQQRQEKALRAGVDIVIACPGRLEDLMKQKIITLESVEITVLDEADHMADLGFLPVVKKLLDTTPTGGQRMLFSATLDNGVDKLVQRYLSSPLTHSVDDPQAAVTTMEHHVLVTRDASEKKQVLNKLAAGTGRRVLFTRTKHHARKLAKALTAAGIPAVDLHGNLSQNARDRNLAEFSTGSVRVLVATDVAARGVHVDEVELVIHVDPPTEHKAYLHRSGRTARAGSDGTVVTLALPEQRLEVGKLMKAAGVDVAFENVTASSELLANLVGEVAVPVDPQLRAQQQASKQPQRGGGTSTGANAQRKRALRTGSGRSGGGSRSGGGARTGEGARAGEARQQAGAARGGRSEGGQRQSSRGENRGGRSQDVAAPSHGSHRSATGNSGSGGRQGQAAAGSRAGSGARSGGAGRTGGAQRAAGGSQRSAGGTRPVYRSETPAAERPARRGPRRATAPASQEKRRTS